MQSLEQEIDRSEQSLTSHGHPVFRGLLADQATAHAEEVRLLRQRVAVLEAALASANAASLGESSVKRAAPHFTSDTPPCRTSFARSEFSQPVSPAVVAMRREDLVPASTGSAETQAAPTDPASAQTTATQTTATQTAAVEADEVEVVSDQGFANAWTDSVESSFEERVAQKAFFQAGSVDEESRNWLLTS